MNMEKPSKDLNLWDVVKVVFYSVKQFFVKAVNLLLQVLKLNYRYKYLTLLFILAGGFCGYFLNHGKKVYKAGIAIHTYGKDAYYIHDLIENLDQYTKTTETRAELTGILGIDSTEMKKIISFKPYYYVKVRPKKSLIDDLPTEKPDYVDYKNKHIGDTINVIYKNAIFVEVRSSDYSIFNDVKTGLYSYLNHNTEMLREYKLKLDFCDDLVKSSDQEFVRLVDLAKLIYSDDFVNKRALSLGKSSNGAPVFIGENKTQILSYNINDFNRLRLAYHGIYDRMTAPVVDQAPMRISFVEQNSIFKRIISFMFVFYILALIISLLHKFRKKIKFFFEN